MALRGVKPERIEKRLKVMFYGAAGCGKSTIAASFPKPYFIDTERGIEHQQYVDLLNKNGGAVFQTCDFDELIKEVKSLISEKHDYQTLVIDPITTLYNDLLDKSALKCGIDFGRHYSESNKQMKHLMNLLIRADLNIVITSHQKNEYGAAMAVIGTTFDSYKKMDYLVDLCVEVQKRGKDRIGVIKKSRIKSLPDGETFPFTYEEIANRYGREILERNSVPEVLATEEEVVEIKRLIDLLKIPQEVYQKWLDKADSFSFDEMPGKIIQKCIESLRSKLDGK
jgi:hypothetical protein